MAQSDWISPATVEDWKGVHWKRRAIRAEQQRDELLEVLKGLVALVDDQFVPDQFTLKKARATIAKVEGENDAKG